MSATTAREEERAAAKALRDQRKMQRGATTAQQRETAAAIREAVLDTRAANRTCRCDFRGVRTKDELRAMGAGCTVWFVCPRLGSVRRRVSA